MVDSILIIDMGFQDDQLRAMFERLEDAGYRCILFKTFDGVSEALSSEALSSAHNKLLLIGVTSAALPTLRDHLEHSVNGGLAIPILLCLIDDQSLVDEEFLALEIDDFSFAPIKIDDILFRVRRLFQRCVADQDTTQCVKQTLMEHPALRQVIGQSPAFTAIKKRIIRLAGCDVPILLTGETGTGKEMCARAIHHLSPRANGPFIPINCSAIPTELFENELFGHEPGAYTDARQRRQGLIAEAEGGTLFLDEVDSLHPLAQTKLLRFLQDKQYKPLGASSYKQANTRLLAATNQDLRSKVQEGSFREDLYFRIKIVSVSLPPLRERRDDIPSLAYHFLEIAAKEYRQPNLRFTRDAIQKLRHYDWPGNVRELENVIRQAVVLTEGQMISARDLKLPVDSDKSGYYFGESFNEAKARVIAAFERNYLQRALSVSGGNISQAARYARKDRRTFFGLLKKHGLRA